MSRDSARKYLFSREHVPSPPEGMVTLAANVSRFVDAMQTSRRFLVKGRSGAGKSTFAFELHRTFQEGREKPPEPAIPVVVRLSKLRDFKNHPDSFIDLISLSVASDKPHVRRGIAKSMIERGSLIMFLDELDYLDSENIKRLEDFIENQSHHCFVCIAREAPSRGSRGEFWREFTAIEIPAWDSGTAKEYIRARILDRHKSEDLIDHLTTLEVFEKHNFSASEWRCLVDLYVDGRIFEIFHPKGFSDKISYSINRSYLKIEIQNTFIDWNDCVQVLGKVALQLMKQGLTTFDPSTYFEDPTQSSWIKRLNAKKDSLLQEVDGRLTFVESSRQSLLAAEYVFAAWPESKKELEDDESRNLLWTPLYNCILPLASEERALDIHHVFLDLGRGTFVTAPQNRSLPLGTTEMRSCDVDVGRGIVESVVRICLLDAGVEFVRAVEALGSLALTLALERRVSFDEDEAQFVLSGDLWEKLRPKTLIPATGVAEAEAGIAVFESRLFVERLGRIRFSENSIPAMLAGKYVGEFWSSARERLRGIPASNPLVEDTYRYALTYADSNDLDEVKTVFRDILETGWNEASRSEFDSLSRKEATGTIADSELAKLENLTTIRQNALCLRSPEEIRSEEERKKAFKELMDALDKYEDTLG